MKILKIPNRRNRMFDWTKIESDEQIKELAALAKEIWNEYSIRFINQDQIDYVL